MPVEFLTDEEAASYGRYNGSRPGTELERAFFLDDADKALIARGRGDHNRPLAATRGPAGLKTVAVAGRRT